ncbi:MAG: peptidoglycan-binding domain-containing protein [Pseudomonadota bacterium]
MPVLKKGAKGNGVKYVQQQLNKAGAKPKLDINGEFDAQMVEAVKTFQKRSGLKPDGIVGDDTIAKLEGKPTKLELRMAKYAWPYEDPNVTIKRWDKEFLANRDFIFTGMNVLKKQAKNSDLYKAFETEYLDLHKHVHKAYREGRYVLEDMIAEWESLLSVKTKGDERGAKAIMKTARALMAKLHQQAKDRDYYIDQQTMRVKRFKTQLKLAQQAA